MSLCADHKDYQRSVFRPFHETNATLLKTGIKEPIIHSFPCCICPQHFRVPITEEFIEHCSEGALSIEVWGHRSSGFGKDLVMSGPAQAKARSVADR